MARSRPFSREWKSICAKDGGPCGAPVSVKHRGKVVSFTGFLRAQLSLASDHTSSPLSTFLLLLLVFFRAPCKTSSPLSKRADGVFSWVVYFRNSKNNVIEETTYG